MTPPPLSPRIVLASASPRRSALLSALGLSFDVTPSAVEEVFEGSPVEMVRLNARLKRDDIARQVLEPSIVIGADTLVFLDEQVLGKPANFDEARRMLAMLSGRSHVVRTGLALVHTGTGQRVEGDEATEVHFRALSPGEIERFVLAVNPIDRAGAYTVDGPGSLLVDRYDGCFQNVLGLPVVRLDSLLREMGCSLFELMDPERARFL